MKLTKRDWSFVAIIGVILALLLMKTGGDKSHKIPSDEKHRPLVDATAMENMHRLHSCLLWSAGKGKPTRMIEEPTEIQARILKAFGHTVTAGGVLHKKES